MYFAGIPDLSAKLEDLVAEGDKVVVRFTAEGTHDGTLLGVPPTGKRMRISGISIYRLAEGKFVEHWEEGDRLGLLQQLGVIPAPAAPATATA
jgi:predicted ester cyclase